MQQAITDFNNSLLIYAFGLGSWPVGSYFISRFGGAVWADIKNLWAKVMPASTPAPVAAPVVETPAAPVTNG